MGALQISQSGLQLCVGCLQGYFGLAPRIHILKNPDDVFTRRAQRHLPTGGAHPKASAIFVGDLPFVHIGIARQYGGIALNSGRPVLFVAVIKNARRLTDQLLRGVAKYGPHGLVAAHHLAPGGKQDAHRRVVKNHLLRLKGAAHALVVLAGLGDVIDQPDSPGGDVGTV